MEFEFNVQPVPQSLLNVDNIGQLAIEAKDDNGCYYYFVAITKLGLTTIATAGPVVPDLDLLPVGYNINISKMDYKEEKLAKAVDKFLNDYRKGITDAYEVDLEEALEGFRDTKDYLNKINEGGLY